MEEMGVVRIALQRSFGAAENRRRAPTEFDRVERVAHSLVYRDVPGDDGNGGHLDILPPKGHHQRNRIVGGGVRVNEKCPTHVSWL
jgi:hypothetical protein